MIDATVSSSSGLVSLFPINELMEHPNVKFSGSGGKYELKVGGKEYQVTYALNDDDGNYVVVVPETASELMGAMVKEFVAFPVLQVSIRNGVVSPW